MAKNMIELEIKTLFQGSCAIRDRYIKKALESGDSFFLRGKDELAGEIMIIPNKDIQKKIVGKSDKPVEDLFNKGLYHYLYYFKWQSQKVQEKML